MLPHCTVTADTVVMDPPLLWWILLACAGPHVWRYFRTLLICRVFCLLHFLILFYIFYFTFMCMSFACIYVYALHVSLAPVVVWRGVGSTGFSYPNCKTFHVLRASRVSLQNALAKPGTFSLGHHPWVNTKTLHGISCFTVYIIWYFLLYHHIYIRTLC